MAGGEAERAETPAEALARISDGIATYDREWRIRYVNSAAIEAMGRPSEQLIGQLMWELFPQAVGGPFYQAVHAAMEAQAACEYEHHSVPLDRWFSMRLFPARDGMTVWSRDITEAKRRELAKHSEDDLSRLVVAHVSDGIGVLDRELRYTLVNPAMAGMAGARVADLLGRSPTDIFPPQTSARIEDDARAALGGRTLKTPPQPAPTREGIRYTSRTVSPLRNSAGEIVGALGLIHDHTEEELAKHEVVASEERLRLALEATKSGVWDWNLQTGDLVWSREQEALLGFEAGTFGGAYEEFLRVVHPDDVAEVDEATRLARDTGGTYEAEYRVRHGGSYRWIRGSGRVTTDEAGESARMVGTAVDITPLKNANELLRIQGAALESMLRSKALQEPLDRLLTGAEELVPGMLCSVLALEGDRLRHVSAPSLPEAYIRAINGAAIGPRAGSCGTAAFTGEPVFVDDISADHRWVDYRDLALAHGLRACWSTPIHGDGHEVVGTFAMYYEHARSPTPWERSVIRMVHHVAEAVFSCDRKRVALEESEARFHDLYENAPDIYLSIDAATQRVLDCNGTALALTGLAKEAVVGAHALDLYAPESHARARATFAELLETGQVEDVELILRCADAREMHVTLNASAVRNPDGSIARARAILRDSTARKQAEANTQRLSRMLLQSRDEERRRIARELHDSTVQNLAATLMTVNRAQRMAPPELEDVLAECADLIAISSKELRTLSYLLHPPLLDDFGLGKALAEYVSGFSHRSGLDVSLSTSHDQVRLDKSTELTLFRVVQECLSNVHRHARATHVRIDLQFGEDEVELVVADDGVGNTGNGAPSSGVGIPGMVERLRYLGGQLTFEPTATGTCVTATVPVDARDA